MKTIICLFLTLCAILCRAELYHVEEIPISPSKGDIIMTQLRAKWSTEQELLYASCVEAIEEDQVFPRKIRAPDGMPGFIVHDVCKKLNTEYATSSACNWNIEAECFYDYSAVVETYAIFIKLRQKYTFGGSFSKEYDNGPL